MILNIFLDDKYLVLKDEPFEMKRILGDNQTQNQKWIYNTYYDFAFNHESPGHGRLWESEKWPGGINLSLNLKNLRKDFLKELIILEII